MAELLEQQSYCGFCGGKVGSSLSSREAHMFSCRKHPAFRIHNALNQIYDKLNDNELSPKDKVATCQLLAACALEQP